MRGGKTMKIKELTFEGEGVFSYISKSSHLEFLDVELAKYLDDILILNHGNRDVSVLVEKVLIDDVDEFKMLRLGNLMSMMFSKKWENNHELLQEQISSDSYNMKVEEKIDTDGLNTNVTSADNKQVTNSATVGYNENDFTDTDENEVSNLDKLEVDGTTKTNVIRSKTTTGNKSNRLEDLSHGLDFLNSNRLYDILISDISKELGTLIY